MTDTNSYCPSGISCRSGYTFDYADTTAQNSCNDVCCSQKQGCNTTAQPTGSCQANNLPTNTCGTYAGSQAYTYTQYVHPFCGRGNTSGNGYTCIPSSACYGASAPSQACTTGFIDNCNSGAGYTCSNGNTCTTSIFVHVYVDYNHDGSVEAEDTGLPGVSVSGSAGSGTTDGRGSWTVSGKPTGSYTVSMSVPAGYAAVNATSQQVTLTNNNGNQAVNFLVTPLYTISGRIYNDVDASRCYNPPGVSCTDNTVNPPVVHGGGKDSLYTSSPSTVTISGNGASQSLTGSTGTYTSGQTLESGTYNVAYTTLPTDYHMTYPVAALPPTFTVTVGTPGKSIACTTDGYNDASCDSSGNIAELDFSMNNENVIHYGWCSDVRDERTTRDYFPNNPVCGTVSGKYAILGNASCVTGPGVYYSGGITPDFGHGGANANNWLAGGSNAENFTPVNPGVIRTSNSYLLTTIKGNGLPTVDVSTVCTTTGCYLPDDLPNGIYTWPYDLTILGSYQSSTGTTVDGKYTFPTGKNYIFVVGDATHASSITFKSKILVPNDTTATFVASQDIFFDPSVGESDITSTAPDMEGFYSADRNVVIESGYQSGSRCNDDGSTKDVRFNLIGAVIANAAGRGGSLQNQRDLCLGDLTCPAYTIGNGDDGPNSNLGLTYLLNAPDVLKHKNFFWQELAP